MENAIKQAKRDFIFIDEAGDPGTGTDYFIVGLIHVTDASLLEINTHLGALRYFGNIRREFKSTKLNPMHRGMLLNILKASLGNNHFVRSSAVYVRKTEYGGLYLEEKEEYPKDPVRFYHLMVRKLLEFHFSNNAAQSDNVELILDRIHPNEEREQQLRRYLRAGSEALFPELNYITQADSRYVELLQIADWVAGSVKEKFFVHTERDFDDLFSYIQVSQIVD